jgi:hypothetical protein
MRRGARRLVYSGVVLACGLGAGGAAVPQDFRGIAMPAACGWC